MSIWRWRLAQAVILASLSATPAMAQTTAATPPRGLSRLEHIVVIYLENHSFDNLFGKFPGAEGLSKAGPYALQVDKAGQAYKILPPVFNAASVPPRADLRFPTDLPNQPFPIDRYMSPDMKTPDLVHRYYQEQAQIDGGKMDKFVAYTDAGGLVMGYQDGSKLALWKYAQQYTLADHFFHAAIGGSFLNHFWTICACTPRYDERAAEPARRSSTRRTSSSRTAALTPDGFVVNTIYTVYAPHPADTDKAQLLPPQTARTIGDALSEKNIAWAWYSGGWNDALAGKPDRIFQYHHQPFAYFAKYGDGTAARREHLKDESDLIADIGRGDAAGRRVLEADRRVQRAPRLCRHPRRRSAYRRDHREDPQEPAVAQHRHHRHLRREWRLLGSCRAAEGRPLGAGHPRADGDHLALRQAALRRSHRLRHDVDPEAHRDALRPRAADERDAKANDLLNAFDFRPKH